MADCRAYSKDNGVKNNRKQLLQSIVAIDMMTYTQKVEKKMETYYLSAEISHSDNSHTLDDYIDFEMGSHIGSDVSVDMLGRNEAVFTINGIEYQVSARGNGDSFNHAVEFTLL